MRVNHVRHEAPQVFTYDLAFADSTIAKQYNFSPGQFNMLYVPGVGEVAISIVGRNRNSGNLLHTIRSVGLVTRALEAAGTGAWLGLRGPFGSSWPINMSMQASEKRDVVIVAGGIGLAPLRALIDLLAENRSCFGEVHVLIGARTPDDLLYVSQHDVWRTAGISVHCTIDRPNPDWKEHVGVVTLLLDRLSLSSPKTALLMTCGPEVMMRYVAQSAIALGMTEENIWVTLERNMNCAIGLCGHCQMGPKFLCKDGPVFPFNQVSKWLRVHDL